VISYAKSPFIWPLLIGVLSCAPFRTKELVQLAVTSGRNSLDSLQAHSFFNYAQHFPNGTEMAIVFITGDSDQYFGIKRRNDSLVYVENSKSIFEIGSITKTFTATGPASYIRRA
jgi:hypothetical protein